MARNKKKRIFLLKQYIYIYLEGSTCTTYVLIFIMSKKPMLRTYLRYIMYCIKCHAEYCGNVVDLYRLKIYIK